SGRVGAARLPLRHLAALLDFPCDLLPSGRAGFEASFDVDLAPFRVRAGDGRFVLHNPHWEKAGLTWTGDDPFVVQAALEGEKVRIHMTPITFEGPVSGVLDMKDAMVEITPHPRFSGLWSLELATRGMDGVRQDSPFLSGDFFGELDTSGWWRFALEGRRLSRPKGVKDVRFSATEGLSLGLRGGGLVLRGEGGEGNFRIETEFDLREMTGELAGDRFRLAHLAGGGRIAGDGPQMTGGMEIRGEKISYDQRDLKSSFPSLIMTADFDGDPVAGWLGRSELKIAEAALQAAGEDFRLSGMAALLPWRYPFSSETAAGHLRIARVNHGQVGLGRIDARLRQEKEGVAWQGSWKNILAPKMDLQFDGFVNATLSDARLDFRLERRKADLNPLLAAYAPGMSSMELRSDLRLQGRFGVNPCGLYGHAGIAVQNLSFHDREMKLQGNDVSLHLEISDIFGPRSRPAQKLSFGRIALGDVAFENGQVLFQIEPEGTLLVEKASFGWCGGKIHSESFRFRPDMEELDVVLYGDRIQLAQILEQLGAGHAEGGGALNGRIPVHYQRGKWIFDDGFLYSTPGKGGVIHVTGMENLTAGIPEDAATFGQIKLAEAALKDYEYRWARVGFNTEQEDLLITLQMDGKPSDLLPFVYRREFGGFVQAEAGFPGSNFQGIRLDLNFRFPLDQLMRYKGLLKMFN
ncbi:MAG: hypothetical protein GX751_07560, partial [Desulfuromonadaceae bacterium]|nr:hypothetical protein [Desulfuromonadaceae bacterium]